MLLRSLLCLAIAAGVCAAQTATHPVGADPIDWSLRRKVFLKKLVRPNAFWDVLPGFVFDQSRNFPKEWGRGAPGVAKRFGSQYGQFVVSETIELGVAAAHHEDPRYHRVPDQPFGARVKHALVSVFVVRNDQGGQTIALSHITGIYGATAAALLWKPATQRAPRRFLINSSIPFASKAGSNAWQEFWPDVKQWRRRRALRKAAAEIDQVAGSAPAKTQP